ncbi:hypothetical protein PIB30_034883 [Stylosanthes scabra]|uniref:Phytocyanin domain-containing protein n=1 Tax=Stylosanthes scabra TaxID=79078 RepID=A0ABU6RDN7_9FABA|nr:hypothetical protein [Stylosanthes scabra]
MIVVAVSVLECTKAEDYIVGGDSIGWTSYPPGGASFYSNWASNHTFKVNDTLVFKFEYGSHAVAILTTNNYEKCNGNETIESYVIGPARVTLNRAGWFYFSCTFSGHCRSGQKLSVEVITGNSSSAPRKAPSTSIPASTASLASTSLFTFLTTLAFNFLFQF